MKREQALQPLSRDHHHALLLCWKIRQGVKNNIEPQRIKKYLDWFWVNYLKPHFDAEEQFLFPVLGNDNELIKQALEEHVKLKYLFESKENLDEVIKLIENLLEKHIRFEERVLFNEIEAAANAEQLAQIQENNPDKEFHENVSDTFWE